MKYKYEYEIQFFNEWHCGSGLAAGADLDALVIKDGQRLPYIPGKTIKGLVREAIEDYYTFQETEIPEDFIKYFGNSKDKDNRKVKYNDKQEKKFDEKTDDNIDAIRFGLLFFSNAELPNIERNELTKQHAQDFMYASIASTRIDDNGTASKTSLRKTEVTIPCKLQFYIQSDEEISKDFLEIINKSVGLIKRIGQNRNRGLGRCQIKKV